MSFPRDRMYLKFRLYGFLKNLRFFDPFIILFFREMGMSFLDIGILFSIREISTNLFEIPTGFIADSVGRRKAMVSAFASYLVSFFIFYLFPSFWMYALAMVFFASGEAFRSGTHKAMILEYLRIKGMEDRKVEYYGHTRAASQFGSAISSLIAIALVFYYGTYRIVFLASTIPYVLDLILMLTYPKYLDGHIIKRGGSWWESTKSGFHATWRDFIGMFRDRRALRAITNSAFFDGIFKSSKDYLQPILKAQALALPVLLYFSGMQRTSVIVGTVYFFLYLLTSLASRSAGGFNRRLNSLTGAINITYLGGALLLLLSGTLTYIGLFPLAIISFIALYALHNLRRPLNVGYISDTISHRTMASGLSVESQIKMLITAAMAPVIGYIADIYGVGASLTVLALIFFAAYPLLALRSGSDKRRGVSEGPTP